MSKIYANPFFWGSPTTGTHYITRTAEENQIAAAMEHRQHLLISGRRGCGKTSLVQQVLQNNSIPSAYLDCRFVVSRETLIQLLLQTMEASFPAIKHSEQLKALRKNPESSALAPVFDLWNEQIKQSDKKFTLVWDDFHHLSKLKNNLLHEITVNLAGRHGMSHIIISHRDDVLTSIFDNPAEQVFTQQTYLRVGAIEHRALENYLTHGFRRMGLSDFDLAGTVLRFTQGHPELTQYVAHALAQLWLEGVTSRLMERTMAKILQEQDTRFAAIWDGFGLNEKRLFHGLTLGFSRPTELKFIHRFGLKATSTAHNTVLKLLREGWLINYQEGYHIYDPLFKSWLERHFGDSE